MADIFLIVANKRGQDSISGIKYFPDCVMEIGHSFTSEITENPVESGESFSDHIQKRNNKFRVRAYYDAYTLNQWGDDAISNLNDGMTRLKEAYAALEAMHDKRSVFTLVSKFKSYPNCTITSLDIPITPENSSRLEFSMEITQFRTARVEQTLIVQVQNVIESKKDDASNKSSSGKKNKTQNQSLARSLEESVRNGFGEAKDLLEATRNLDPTGGATPP